MSKAVAIYEQTQSALAETQKLFPGFETPEYWQKYNGGPLSANFQEGREQAKRAKENYKWDLEQKQALADKARNTASLIVKQEVENTLSKLVVTQQDGNRVIADMDVVADQSKRIAQKYGQASESYFQRLVYNELKSASQFQAVKPEVDKRFEELAGKELETIRLEAEKQSMDLAAKYQTASKNIALELGAMAKQEVKDVEAVYKEKTAAAKAQYDQQLQLAQARAAEMQKAVQSGQMTPEEYEVEVTRMQASLTALGQQIEKGAPSYDAYVNTVRQINNKYNSRYAREVEELRKTAEAEYDQLKQKFGNVSEEQSKALEAKYNQAFSEVMRDRNIALRADEAPSFSKPFAFGTLFLKTVFNGLGSAMSGMGANSGIQWMEEMGDKIVNDYQIANVQPDGFWDYLSQPDILIRNTGQLAGVAAPGMLAGLAVTAATSGAGAPAAVSALAGSLTSFSVETADMAGRAYREAFERSGGDAGKAEVAAQEMFQAQLDIVGLYAFEMLPFVDNVLDFIPSKAGRVLASGASEVATEVPQEFFQNIAEENISQGKDRWDGIAEKVTDAKKWKETLVSVAPVAFMGMGGAAFQKSDTQNLADYVSQVQVKQAASKAIPGALEQTVLDMLFEQGLTKTRATLSALYASGTITKQEYESLSVATDSAITLDRTAKEQSLNTNDRYLYTYFGLKAKQALETADAVKETDPAAAKFQREAAAAYTSKASELLAGKDVSFFVMKFRDGSSKLFTVQEAGKVMRDPNVMSQVKAGKIRLEAYGSEALEATEQMNTVAKQKVWKKEDFTPEVPSPTVEWEGDDVKVNSVQETPQAGGVGVGGDVEIKNEGKADAPTKESVTERLSINNPFYKKVEDALVKLGLIEKYNAETGTGDVVGGYAQQTSDGGFSVGKMLFSQDGSISYFDGDVKVSFDKNGNVISENTKEAKQKANVLAIESKKESIDNLEKTRDSEAFKYKEVTETDVLGNKKKVKRLKTPQELKESTDKINAAIDKAKSELSELEQSLKETPKAKGLTPSTNEKNALEVSQAISESSSLYDQVYNPETTAQERRKLKAQIKDIIQDHPFLKYIYKNIKSINDQLESKGLITKKGNCP